MMELELTPTGALRWAFHSTVTAVLKAAARAVVRTGRRLLARETKQLAGRVVDLERDLARYNRQHQQLLNLEREVERLSSQPGLRLVVDASEAKANPTPRPRRRRARAKS